MINRPPTFLVREFSMYFYNEVASVHFTIVVHQESEPGTSRHSTVREVKETLFDLFTKPRWKTQRTKRKKRLSGI